MKLVLVEDLSFPTLLNPPHNFRTDVCRCFVFIRRSGFFSREEMKIAIRTGISHSH